MAGSIVVFSLDERDHHDTGRGHPERAARLDAVMRGVDEAQLGDALFHAAPRPASRDERLPARPPHEEIDPRRIARERLNPLYFSILPAAELAHRGCLGTRCPR